MEWHGAPFLWPKIHRVVGSVGFYPGIITGFVEGYLKDTDSASVRIPVGFLGLPAFFFLALYLTWSNWDPPNLFNCFWARGPPESLARDPGHPTNVGFRTAWCFSWGGSGKPSGKGGMKSLNHLLQRCLGQLGLFLEGQGPQHTTRA